MTIDYKTLTPEQQAKPYAKYFYRAPANPNPQLMGILSQGPMDHTKALPLDRFDDLLLPGYQEIETGYCVLDNGIGYVAVNNTFPNCTVDMMKWWFSWHPLDGLRYRLWYPPGHAGIAISEKDRQKILDPNIPLDEKYTNVDHFVIEDIGGGYDDIVISFLKPEDMGFTKEALAKSDTKAVFGGFGVTEPRDHPGQKVPAIMMHLCREIDGGVEFRTRFYLGCRINKGIPMCVLPPGVKVPEIAAMGLAFHNVMEYSNLAALLPELYKEFGPEVK